MFHENRLADDSREIACLTFFRKLGKVSQNLSSNAVVIGALRVKFGRCVMHETMVIIALHFSQ